MFKAGYLGYFNSKLAAGRHLG